MGKKEADPETAKLQQANWRAFRDWLKSNKKQLMAMPGRKTVIYAGYPTSDLVEVEKGLREKARGVWEIVNAVEAQAREYSGYGRLDTLHDVLKRRRGPLPKLVEATGANRGHPKKYPNMLEVADGLASNDWQLLSDKYRRFVWHMLSKRYVANAAGEVEVWEGARKQIGQLNSSFIMIRTELKELAKNESVDAGTMAKVEKMLQRYQEHYASVGKEIGVLLKRVRQNMGKIARETG